MEQVYGFKNKDVRRIRDAVTTVENAVMRGVPQIPRGLRLGGGGGGGSIPATITGTHPDSPVTGERIYRGDLYSNGKSKVATKLNVTIRILQIADQENISAGTMLLVTAIANDTWTSATSSGEVTETTYQGQIPVWL